MAKSLPVTREGFVLIPLVGEVFVNNLTLDQLRGLDALVTAATAVAGHFATPADL